MPTSPTVLYITRAYGPEAGGMERLSFELADMLRDTPVKLRVLAYRGPRSLSPLYIITCLPQALLLARTSTVIHLGDPLLSFVGWLLKKLFRKKVVVTVHGLDISYPSRLYQWYLRHFFPAFDRYVAISHHVHTLLASHNISANNIVVINPGIHDRFYNPSLSRENLSRLLNEPVDSLFIVCTVGRLVSRKGHAWFIQYVLPHLPAHVRYVIAGQGAARAEIEQTAVAADCRSKVVFLDRVSEDSLKILYNTVDAFVQPNIKVAGDVEGFGIVLLEASSCGRLVLAARAEGITDAIIDGVTGRILPSGDAAAWVAAVGQATSGKLLAPTTTRHATLENFGWPTVVQHYVKLYTSLVSVV